MIRCEQKIGIVAVRFDGTNDEEIRALGKHTGAALTLYVMKSGSRPVLTMIVSTASGATLFTETVNVGDWTVADWGRIAVFPDGAFRDTFNAGSEVQA